MNPFDLTGPEFLIFFTTYGVVVCSVLAFALSMLEDDSAVPPSLTDPFAIAYLRAGVRGALQVAIVSLLDHGLVHVKDDKLIAEPEARPPKESHPLEDQVLDLANPRVTAPALAGNSKVAGCCKQKIEPRLIAAGLLPNAELRQRRTRYCGLALALILIVAAVKMFVALARGHSNVAFLIIEAIVFALVVAYIARNKPTRKGREAMLSLAGLCGNLRQRSKEPKTALAHGEMLLMAAVFATPAIPGAARFLRLIVAPQGGGGGCGSSFTCSGDAGSSCSSGSSCGGGGGGSGCGGCGAS